MNHLQSQLSKKALFGPKEKFLYYSFMASYRKDTIESTFYAHALTSSVGPLE